MKNHNENITDAALLRKKAEEQLSTSTSLSARLKSISEAETLKLIHELEVHQIELEMQNEELVIAKERAELAEEKYTELYDFAPSGYLSLTKEGVISELNFVAAKMLGKERSHLIKKRFELFVSIDTQMTFNLFLQEIFTSKVKQTCEIIIAIEGNLPIYVNIDGIENINNELCLLTLIDITERKYAGIALKESEIKFKNVIWDMQVGVLLQGSQAEILLSNPKAFEFLGLSEDQLLGKTSFDPDWNVIHEDGSPFPGCKHPVPQVIATRKSVQNVIMGVYHPAKLDYVWLLVDAEPQFNSDGSVNQVVCSFIDISERKLAEKQLQIAKEKIEESEEKYKAAFYTSPDSVNINKLNGEYIEINEGFTRLTGYTQDDVIGKLSSEIEIWQIPEDRVKMIDSLQKYGIIENLESIFRTKNGTLIPALMSAKIIKLHNSPHILSVTREITELKRFEQELILAKERAEESDRLKSAFLANMSHEIRTPMNGILGFADLLKEPDLSGDDQQKYIDIIEKSGKRMLSIINDIIDISKIEAGLMKIEMQESNINEQIEYIFTFFKPEVESKGLKLFFKTELPEKEALITTDREKLYAILINLVKNAIKYTPSGSIEFGYVSTSSTTASESEVGERLVLSEVEVSRTPELEFYVKDTGIGIPRNRQQAIFERFVQADIDDEMARQGAGLGLAITKSYVEMLGGKIWVESEESKGSCFYFTLPYHTKTEAKNIAEEQLSCVENKINNLKILIAEDDETSETLLSILLVTYSKDILKVKNGIDAVDICRQNPDIDLIMMDIRMPVFGGYEATRQIRQFNKDVIIIAQTAFGLAGDREKALEAGCNDYISKPINKNEILMLIQKYFRKIVTNS